MNQFEFAQPKTEDQAVELLSERKSSAILGSGMDIVTLLQKNLIDAERVVDVSAIESLRGIQADGSGNVTIGALTTLEALSQNPMLADYPTLNDVIHGIRAIQVQQTGTIGGDLCHLPNCWYFRSGYGLFGREGKKSLPEVGDNRYHAIIGNDGPAKYVSASRFAPGLISLGAEVRIVGPQPGTEKWISLEQFYRTPKHEQHGVTVLEPGQLLTHLRIPRDDFRLNATYEVLETQGLDWPLAAAAVSLKLNDGIVDEARVVLGHVAPVPWVSQVAARCLIGQPVDRHSAELTGRAAVANATPLKHNVYKVQLTRTAVARAILKATEQLEGGL